MGKGSGAGGARGGGGGGSTQKTMNQTISKGDTVIYTNPVTGNTVAGTVQAFTLTPVNTKTGSKLVSAAVIQGKEYPLDELKPLNATGTKLTMGGYKYTKTGPNTWMTFGPNGKRVKNRTDADIKRVFSGR